MSDEDAKPAAEEATPAAEEATPAAEEAAAAEDDKPIVYQPSKVNVASLLVGDEVNSWCGKCKSFQPHKVKTLQAPKPPKSSCISCKAIHQVRLVQPGTKSKDKSAGRVMPDVRPWIELVAGLGPEHATDYAITGNFEAGDVVMHKTFGLGRVVARTAVDRVQVSFEVGIKWLIQNYQR